MSSPQPPQLPYITATTSSGLDIDYLSLNDGNDGLIVFMSNALVPGREDRSVPAFHRWSWAASFPESRVLVFADPGLRKSPIPDGAWYLDPEHDTLGAIGEIVTEVAKENGVSLADVVYYGSSLGGYGALCAAAVTGSRAIVEVPQIDVGNWFPGAIKKIEDYVLGCSLDDLREKYPERVGVWERFLAQRCIPQFTILTNEADKCFDDQLALVGKVREDALGKGVRADVVITAATKGHQVLPKDEVTRRIREVMRYPSPSQI